MTTPEQRSLNAQVAVHTSWANTKDRTARTAPGTKAFMDRFERQVDPDGEMDPVTRAKAAENAKRAYFLGLSAKSARVRARRKQARDSAA
jgi:hypothetical protein